jgi:hypothetical protein
MRRVGLVAAVGALACGTTASAPPPAPARTAPAPASPDAAPIGDAATAAGAARVCPAPFEVPPPYADPFIADAAKLPAVAAGAWWTATMAGPLPSIPSGCAEVRRLDPVPPFTEIVHCSTGDRQRPLGPDNQARHVLAVRTVHGWWTHELAHERWPHGGPDEEPKVAGVDSIAARDLVGDRGAEIAAVTEVGPPGGAQTRVVHVCGFTGGPAPVCAPIRVAAGGPFHGAGASLLHLSLACDGTLVLVGWQGGATLGLVHARYTLPFR